jgi:hypothetical protein
MTSRLGVEAWIVKVQLLVTGCLMDDAGSEAPEPRSAITEKRVELGTA